MPAPLPTAHLAALFDQLAPPEQAALHAQLAQVEEDLRAALDQFPYTPPPQPTDPAVWRPLIIQAIDSQARLQMTYFTAGRNLTTSRLVEPYWLEEVRGVPYLRAYCHSAGRVLIFRLDRIEALTLCMPDPS